MRKETDLNQVKDLAKTFLMLDIAETRMSPLIVRHPFTDTGIVAFRKEDGGIGQANLLEDKRELQKWRRQMTEQIDRSESAFHIHLMVTKPYRLAFLKYAQPYLSQKDFSEILNDAWVRSESPNNDPNVSQKELLAMFRDAEPTDLMDEDEYLQFKQLDDTVTVYRGVTSYNAEKVKALSWSLDYDKAKWFAHRFGEDGKVYEAQIDKEHILAYFNSRNEQEVIVDPKHLIDISEAEGMDDGFLLSQ